jgi:hypothetical protein
MFDKELKRLNDNIETTKVQAGIIKDRVAGHVRRNKGTYIGIVVSGVVSGTAGVILSRGSDVTVSPKIQQGVNYKSPSTNTINNVVTVIRAGKGPLGNAITRVSDGKQYRSQRDACLANGISEATLRHHLRGETPTAGGEKFEVLREAKWDR